MRQAQIAEQDRVYQQSVNTEKEKAVGAALQIIRSGGTLKNDTLCYYKDDGSDFGSPQRKKGSGMRKKQYTIQGGNHNE